MSDGFVKPQRQPSAPTQAKALVEITQGDLLGLCLLCDVDPAEVAKELKRDTALSQLVKRAFGLDAIGLPRKPRGRPRKNDVQLRDAEVFEVCRRSEKNIEAAYARAAEIRSAEGRHITEDGIRSAVSRLRAKPANIFDDAT